MSATFTVETYQPPLCGTWPSQGGDESAISRYDGDFPKQEIFDDVDLSNIPISMLSDPGVEASSLESMPFADTAFGPQQPGVLDSPPFHLPQRSTAMMGRAKTPPQSGPGEAMTPTHGHKAGEPGSTPDAKRGSSSRHSPRKRKSTCSITGSSSRSSTSPPPSALQPRKTTHNMIEKRYRTNLNDKIAALRDAVPSLRVMVHRLGREVEGLEEADLLAETESLGGLAPAHKLNKATVLSKATEYIAHLERNNAALIRENSRLRNRVAGLEMVAMGRGSGFSGVWG